MPTRKKKKEQKRLCIQSPLQKDRVHVWAKNVRRIRLSEAATEPGQLRLRETAVTSKLAFQKVSTAVLSESDPDSRGEKKSDGRRGKNKWFPRPAGSGGERQ
jgi:hypothetical protein